MTVAAIPPYDPKCPGNQEAAANLPAQIEKLQAAAKKLVDDFEGFVALLERVYEDSGHASDYLYETRFDSHPGRVGSNILSDSIWTLRRLAKQVEHCHAIPEARQALEEAWEMVDEAAELYLLAAPMLDPPSVPPLTAA